MRRPLASTLVLLVAAIPAAAGAAREDSGVQQSQAAGQGSSAAASGDGQVPASPGLPVSLDRIKQGLAGESTLKLEVPPRDDIPRFYVEVRGTPTFSTFLEGFDLKNGPVPGAGMTHNEFLAMVAPKDLYSQAGFGGLDMLTSNIGFAALMYLANKAFVAMKNARSEAELQAIREQIQRELAEIERANAEKKKSGGGPPSPH